MGAIGLLRIEHLHERIVSAIPFETSPDLFSPQLAIPKVRTRHELLTSLVELLRGPAAPREFAADTYFRECWIDQRLPKKAFFAAVAIQAVLVIFPPPIWTVRQAHASSASPRTELAWYGPVKDFPAMFPAHPPKPVIRKDAPEPESPKGADAFHPRQTILSTPLHPTHPRQTLVRPSAPQEPPKILPDLPNIVQLASAQPERPALQLTSKQLSSLRPKVPAAIAAASIAAPEIAQESQAGMINIASSPNAPRKPLLPVNPMSAPRALGRPAEANAAAPEIARGDGARETLIALSAAPAPVAPPAIPAGNLSARVAISPDGRQPGAPPSPSGTSGHGPEGIFISGGATAKSGPVSGAAIGALAPGVGDALPAGLAPRATLAPRESKRLPTDGEANTQAVPKLGMAPERVLGAKRVYTLHVNMPNLTSASGSWVLNFAELNETAPLGAAASADLGAPVPVRKVDPKYPPELRNSHVDGEVILYAIIRKDGSVDSIQLVHSVDPHLDANAMEALAQWKFVPAERHGEPVDLEAVVHIPFRSKAPVF